MSAAPPERIYVERARPRGRGRRLHLGAPAGPDGQGQGASRSRSWSLERLAGAGVAPQDPVRAAASSAGRRELADARAPAWPTALERHGPGRRHRGRGRHGQVAARRRVRPDARRRGHHRGLRRVPGVRDEHAATSPGARSGAGCSASRTTTRGGRRSRHLERRAGRDRPGARRPRAAARATSSGCRSPTRDLTRSFDAKLRKASLEDLLAAVPPGAGATEAAVVIVLEDCHWIDELSRDLLQRPDPRPRRRCRVAVRARLPARRGARRRPRGRAARRASRRSPSTAWTPRRRRAARPLEAGAARSAATASRRRDELVELVADAVRRQPVLRRGARSTSSSRQGIDASRPGGDARPCSLPESLHTLVLSRIDAAAEDAAPDDEGRERRRPRVRGADAAGRLPGARAPRRRPAATSRRCGRSTSSPLDREADQAWMFKHVVTQEVAYESLPFALRGDAPRPGRRRTSSARRPDDLERQLCRCSRTTTGAATDEDEEASSTCGRRPRPPRPPTRTTPRSPTTTASSRCSTDAERVARAAGPRQGPRAHRATGHGRRELDEARCRSPVDIGDRRRAGRGHCRARRGRPQAGPLRRGVRAARRGRGPCSRQLGRRRRHRARSLHLAGTVAAQRGDYDDGAGPLPREPRDPGAARRPRPARPAPVQPAIVAEYAADFAESRRLNERGARGPDARSATAGRSRCRTTTSA